MFYQIFLSPQAKQYTINTYKHGINELLHELPNDSRLISKEIRKYQESVQTPQNDGPVPSAKIKIFVNTSKKLEWRIAGSCIDHHYSLCL